MCGRKGLARAVRPLLFYLLNSFLLCSFFACYDSQKRDNKEHLDGANGETNTRVNDNRVRPESRDATYADTTVDGDTLSTICESENVNGLRIDVQYPHRDACYRIDVTVRDGDYSEQLVQNTPGVCLFTGAVNRPGSYTIVVSGEFIYPIESGPVDVSMSADGCRIDTQSVVIDVEVECHDLSAYPYNELNDCLEPLQPLDGVCARSANPEDDMGTGTTQCIISPEGVAYLIFLTYTESLEVEDWFTQIPPIDGSWRDLCQKVYEAQSSVSEKQYDEGIEYYNDWFYHLASCDQNTEL